jgi:purine-binding chemotaxis protein CheW
MDILAARKKAAERERTQNGVETNPTVSVQSITPGTKSSGTEGPVPSSSAVGKQPAVAKQVAVEKPDIGKATELEGTANEIHTQDIEMLSFRLGNEEYVLPVDDVQEVLKSRELTMVPNAPQYVLGVTSIRGTVLPVLDLGMRLGLPPAKRDEKTRIIIISPEDEDAGILVDRVTGVVRISPNTVRPAPETIEQGAEFLKGIARKDDRLYILLDLHKAVAA